MKYALGFLVLIAALVVVSDDSAIASHDAQPVDAAVESVSGHDDEFCSATGSDIESQSTPAALPSCWNYQGNACSTLGVTLRCQWQPLEPGMCGCVNYAWSCG